jgi:hypothetical protein
MERLVNSRSESDVAIVRDNTDARARSHLTSSAVVYHDHFEITECLAIDGGQAFVEGFVSSQSRNGHGHGWVDLAGYHRGSGAAAWSGAAAKPQANTYDRIVACTDIYYTFSWLVASWRKRRGILAKSVS